MKSLIISVIFGLALPVMADSQTDAALKFYSSLSGGWVNTASKNTNDDFHFIFIETTKDSVTISGEACGGPEGQVMCAQIMYVQELENGRLVEKTWDSSIVSEIIEITPTRLVYKRQYIESNYRIITLEILENGQLRETVEDFENGAPLPAAVYVTVYKRRG